MLSKLVEFTLGKKKIPFLGKKEQNPQKRNLYGKISYLGNKRKKKPF
jgi:hypothetical protein